MLFKVQEPSESIEELHRPDVQRESRQTDTKGNERAEYILRYEKSVQAIVQEKQEREIIEKITKN